MRVYRLRMGLDDYLLLFGIATLAAGCSGDDAGGGTTGGMTSDASTDGSTVPTTDPPTSDATTTTDTTGPGDVSTSTSTSDPSTSTDASDPSTSSGTGTPDDLCEAYGRHAAECQYEPRTYDQNVEFYTMVCDAEFATFDEECIALAEEFYACFIEAECAELASGMCKAEALPYLDCLPGGSTG